MEPQMFRRCSVLLIPSKNHKLATGASNTPFKSETGEYPCAGHWPTAKTKEAAN
jgi:hypothetical protein